MHGSRKVDKKIWNNIIILMYFDLPKPESAAILCPIIQALVPNLKKIAKQQFSYLRVERLIKKFEKNIILMYFDPLNMNLLLFWAHHPKIHPKP